MKNEYQLWRSEHPWRYRLHLLGTLVFAFVFWYGMFRLAAWALGVRR